MEHTINWILLNGWAVLKVIMVFGLIIFVHEFGHFIAARKVGVRAPEFSLGMGPKIFSFKDRKTEYQLRLFPVGGFVKIEGEDEKCENTNDPGNFQNRSVLERSFIVFNGCFLNYIMAIVLFFIVAAGWGIVTAHIEPTATISRIIESMPADRAGIKPQDKIIAIDGTLLRDGRHMLELINKSPRKKITLTVEREGRTFNVSLTPFKDIDTGDGKIGIVYDVVIMSFDFEKVSIIDAVKFSLSKTYEITIAPVRVVAMLIKKEMPVEDIARTSAGPVGIMQMTFVMAKKGLPQILFFCALLNAAIGFFNLIPFPALDGSRLLFLAVEGIRKKPIDQKKEGFIHWIGLMILLVLVAAVTFQDILRIIQGKSFFK